MDVEEEDIEHRRIVFAPRPRDVANFLHLEVALPSVNFFFLFKTKPLPHVTSAHLTATTKSQWIQLWKILSQTRLGMAKSKSISLQVLKTLQSSWRRVKGSFLCPPVSRTPTSGHIFLLMRSRRRSQIWSLPNSQFRVYAQHRCANSLRFPHQWNIPPHNS